MTLAPHMVTIDCADPRTLAMSRIIATGYRDPPPFAAVGFMSSHPSQAGAASVEQSTGWGAVAPTGDQRRVSG